MVNLGWAAPTTCMQASSARQGILWQHQRIRELLDKARFIAEAALDGVADSPDAVATIIADLHSTLEVHRTFEERVLLPIFLASGPDGLVRANQLQDDHKRQREVLATVQREATLYPQLPTLAAKLAFLTSWLLTDMEEEERTLPTQDDTT